MEIDLENLSKEQLLALIKKQSKTISKQDKINTKLEQKTSKLEQKTSKLEQEKQELQRLVDLLRRMQFGQKRERFEDPNQTQLPLDVQQEVLEEQEEVIKQEITYSRQNKKHPGRAKLPDHLPVEEIEIYPEGDLSDKICIGKETTDVLDYVPGYFKIKRYIRYKYATKDKDNTQISIALLPERIIDKGIPSEGLLSTILVDKYVDHLPLYRQKQRFSRENIDIASSTIDGWAAQSMDALKPLYEKLVMDIKNEGYLQVDETTIKVLDEKKKDKSHLGYYWVYHAPISKLVMFNYSPTRSGSAALPILENFKGYLQTDGYSGYKAYGAKSEVTHLGCWAHARREFERALDNDKTRAQHVLVEIQKLYAVERKAKEQNLTPQEIKELRLKESLPIINELGKYMFIQMKLTLPKSQIGKAFTYSQTRWDNLSAYLYDGNLQIDNNLIENVIRPVALGRKNYLFAGSHDAAQRAAIAYTFFANCKKHDINPYQWLKYVLENIQSINHKNITDLYPHNYKKLIVDNVEE
ncbi:IS66 family transposase [Myroides odoratimimus]|uniref:IS66 family transposase n=2 Tax=Myroides odoratimimus TaxID=76832 RepID=UPI0025762354|nr:IS66 family transposase [Myroides odoratimimus]MDM1328847.1 IS66 family transposase [Myroides odoratimimus]MDM1514352.1 IS66 family transposase [Myroides odoratimimus]